MEDCLVHNALVNICIVFLTAAIINDYKLSDLKEHRYYLIVHGGHTSENGVFTGLKSRASAELCSFWSLQEKIYFL